LDLLGDDMGINMFGCSRGSAGERKLHIQGDAEWKVNVLGGGSDGNCEINCNSEMLPTYSCFECWNMEAFLFIIKKEKLLTVNFILYQFNVYMTSLLQFVANVLKHHSQRQCAL